MTKEEYNVSIEQEVLSESVSTMNGWYFHYADKLGVLDDESHPVMKTSEELFALKDVVFACKTMQELDEVRKKIIQYGHKLKVLEEQYGAC